MDGEGEPGGEAPLRLLPPPQRPLQWPPPLAHWVRDTLAFVAAYPRVAGGWGQEVLVWASRLATGGRRQGRVWHMHPAACRHPMAHCRAGLE